TGEVVIASEAKQSRNKQYESFTGLLRFARNDGGVCDKRSSKLMDLMDLVDLVDEGGHGGQFSAVNA
ncbi:MAG: hypothetical protein LBR29_00675, partial [Methylobacteriaceae bacterium]|nr:hypothetical protein [Methylobacteriaceae bacterium]